MSKIGKIVSGGQTGADRAALDFALAKGIPHGGWCPLGRWAEDGPIAARYQLMETPAPDPVQRTEWNARDSDGTVLFSLAPTLSSGSQKTAELACWHRKPLLHVTAEQGDALAAEKLRQFLAQYRVQVLNVAGSRASEEPEIGAFVKRVLAAVTGR